MQHIHVPSNIVLRVEQDYFDSWIAFNSKTYQTIKLTVDEFFLLEELKRESIPFSDFEIIWPHVSLSQPTERAKNLREIGVLNYSSKPVQHESSPGILDFTQIGSRPDCTHLSSPTELEICLTRRCNQRCVHCNVSAVSERKKEKLDVDFWLNLIDQAIALRVLRLTLTGGEPFVREGINDILAHLVTKPVGCIILTNASMISTEQIRILKSGSITLSISLDGTTSEQHDGFRRSPGAFNATIKTINLLRTNGIKFVISTVLHKDNVQSASGFIELAEKLGASRLVIVPMAAVGRASSLHSKQYFPANDQLASAIDALKTLALSTPGIDVIIGNPDPGFRELTSIQDRYSGATAMSRRNPGLCKAGIYSMAVDEDGMAYSCLRGLQERIHPIGNLREASLAEVWVSTLWKDFRDISLPMVSCRVEEIASRRNAAFSSIE